MAVVRVRGFCPGGLGWFRVVSDGFGGFGLVRVGSVVSRLKPVGSGVGWVWWFRVVPASSINTLWERICY